MLRAVVRDATMIQLDPKMTVLQLKKKYLAKANKTNANVVLTFQGRSLSDNKTLANYNISEDDNIHVTIRMQGGK